MGYARARGLRVVPEVTLPAHATALLLAKPELAPPDTPTPTALAETWGVHKLCLDVSSEEVRPIFSFCLLAESFCSCSLFVLFSEEPQDNRRWNPATQASSAALIVGCR